MFVKKTLCLRQKHAFLRIRQYSIFQPIDLFKYIQLFFETYIALGLHKEDLLAQPAVPLVQSYVVNESHYWLFLFQIKTDVKFISPAVNLLERRSSSKEYKASWAKVC